MLGLHVYVVKTTFLPYKIHKYMYLEDTCNYMLYMYMYVHVALCCEYTELTRRSEYVVCHPSPYLHGAVCQRGRGVSRRGRYRSPHLKYPRSSVAVMVSRRRPMVVPGPSWECVPVLFRYLIRGGNSPNRLCPITHRSLRMSRVRWSRRPT